MSALSEMDVCDMFYCAQIHLIVGVYFLISSEITTATRYIKHAVEIIERSPDSFLPPLDDTSQTATPLGTSEEVQVQERFALMAHIVNCRSLLRIHVLEKKIKTVHADVLNDLPVRIILIDVPLCYVHTDRLAGYRCARNFRRPKRTT
jgi:hypothetical protein